MSRSGKPRMHKGEEQELLKLDLILKTSQKPLPNSRLHSFALRFEVYLQYERAEPLHVGGPVVETAAVNYTRML
jgi:hypothetical protein